MKVRAVWQFFEAERDGNAIHLFAPGVAHPTRHASTSDARPKSDGLCLSDYVLDPDDGRRDHIALFVVTAGEGVSERAEESQDRPASSSKRMRIQALAIETAEACAEWLHRRIREDWGFPGSADYDHAGALHARAIAASATASAIRRCPNLEDQQGIWKLLHPDEIGVQLTEGIMMEPEASVSALVFHHPDCAYFTAAEGAEAA